MKRIRNIALALALVAAPQVLSAQDPAPAHPRGERAHGGRGQGARMGDPFARLLEQRQQLGLSSQQVAQIEAIRSRLQAQNRPLVEQLQAARRQAGLPERGEARGGERPRLTEEQRQAMRQLRERTQPVAEQLRANNRTAMREVHGILTEQQRTQLRQLHQQHGGRGHGGRRMRGGGRRGGGDA
jgi:periplasmic protein CpxP/Spy